MDNKSCLLALYLASIFCLICFISCSKQAAKQDTCKIGAIVFLTGPQSLSGIEVKRAMEIAVDEINAQGGIKGKRLEIQYEDSKDNPKDAIMAFNKLLLEKVPLVITTGDVVSLKLAPMATANHIPMIATIAAGPDITKQGPLIFRAFVTAEREGKTLAEYAIKKLGLESASILSINNEYGVASAESFKQKFESLGSKLTRASKILSEETFEMEGRDARIQIMKLKEKNPQAIFLTGFGPGYPTCMRQIRELGYKGLLLTNSMLQVPWAREQTTPANEGAYYCGIALDTNSHNRTAVKFKSRYLMRFKSEPSFFGAFGYDTLKIAAAALQNTKSNEAEDICKSLLALKQEGAVGDMEFDSNHSLNFPFLVHRLEKDK